jgi:hypothetical protein
MQNDDDFQREFNMHLRRNVVLTYLDTKYNVSLNLTKSYISSIKVLEGIDDVADSKLSAIENYLRVEGFFEINKNYEKTN